MFSPPSNYPIQSPQFDFLPTPFPLDRSIGSMPSPLGSPYGALNKNILFDT